MTKTRRYNKLNAVSGNADERTLRAFVPSCLCAPRCDPASHFDVSTVRRFGVSGFTLIEMMVTIAIISVVLSFSAFAFRKATESNVLAQAKNAVLTYAKIARSYAIANQIETMMVVNPYNGRFELWHLNPPPGGGPFEALSPGSPPAPPFGPTNMDGYTFAPVFDSGARIPPDGRGRPLAAVHPIDFADPVNPLNPGGPVWRETVADSEERNIDNLTWATFCFDRSGELVIRTRRIATRSYTMRDGSQRAASERNRLIDESPDLAIFRDPSLNANERFLVYGGSSGDTPITSTRGFIISEAQKLRLALGNNPTPAQLVNSWLLETRPGGRYSDFASTVILNRCSGEELTGDD